MIPYSQAFLIGSSGGIEFARNLTPPTPYLSRKKIVVLHASPMSYE